MGKNFISPKAIAKPAGAYSHGVLVGNIVFVAGQIGMDPDGRIPIRNFRAQAEQVFENIKAVLIEAGATFDNVVKVNGYIIDMDMNFAIYSEVRSKYMSGDNLPAATLVEVKSLVPREALLEVEVIAILD